MIFAFVEKQVKLCIPNKILLLKQIRQNDDNAKLARANIINKEYVFSNKRPSVKNIVRSEKN